MLEEQQEIQTASVFERAIAFVFDLLIFFSAWFWSYVYMLKVNPAIAPWQSQLYYFFFLLFFVLYSAYFTTNGRNTLGKFLMGIKVVDKNNHGRIAFPRALMRAFSYYLSILTCFAGFAIAFLTKDSRALEDYIASTKVIRTREKSPAEIALTSAMGVIIIAATIFYIYYAMFVAPSAYDRVRLVSAHEQLVDIAILEDIHYYQFGKYTDNIVRLSLLSGDSVQFQRDVQENLKRGGFAIGFDKQGYQIVGVAKDSKSTPVQYSYKKQ